MADEIVYKKVTRKADKGLEGKIVAKHGKQTNQKLKPYVVLQYLLKYSDENNTKSAYDIIGYLEGCGISAERRSIYRDIKDINRIMLMLQEDIDLDEADRMFAKAEESGDEEELNELKTVLYDKNKKGFYVRHFWRVHLFARRKSPQTKCRVCIYLQHYSSRDKSHWKCITNMRRFRHLWGRIIFRGTGIPALCNRFRPSNLTMRGL